MRRRISADEILEDIQKLEIAAEDFGKTLANAEAQIRKMFATVLESKDLAIVKPRVMYQAVRFKGDEQERYKIKELAKRVGEIIDRIRAKPEEDFDEYKQRLEQFMEAVVAYARYYKEMGREY